MLQDLRFAIRTLRKRSNTTAIAVLILALGIGATTVVFSLVEAMLLRPFDFQDSDRLMRVYATQDVNGGDRLRVTQGAFYDWRRESRSFDALIASTNMGMSVTDSERPLNPLMRQVSEGYFELLGAVPLLGRSFLAEEYAPGARVTILHYGFWQSYFGGESDVLGRTIELADEAYEIVGVMPAGYRNFAYPQPPVLWLPLPTPAEPDRRRGSVVVFGRLARGITHGEAAAEMDGISERLAALHPGTDAGRGVRVVSYRDGLVERIRPALLALFGAVGLVLVMACANVANLLLARAVDRQQEIAVRLAMGASRLHLVRQLMIESLMLGLAAAGLGLLMAFWAIGPLPALAPPNINVPLLDSVRLNGTVAAFTVLLSLLTGLVFGLLPMVQVSRTSGAALVAGSRGGATHGRRRLRSSLVVAEVALSLILLVGAGLMVRSFTALQSLDLGFEPDGVTIVRTGARGALYAKPDRFPEFHRSVAEELARLPGVDRVGACEILPMFAAFRPSFPGRDAGSAARGPGEQERVVPMRVSVGFFEAFGTPLLRGRDFTRDDRGDTDPVAIVTRGVARRIWGDQDPIGREFVLGEGEAERTLRIVGLAADLRGLAQSPEPPPILYVPQAQDLISNMTFFMRSELDAETLVPQAEDAIWGLSREVPVYASATLQQIVTDIDWQPRMVSRLLSGFAIFALLLAATGLFAVLSYSVLERNREIGIRMAVGAGRRDVLRLVVGDAARLTALGLGLGLVLALCFAGLLGNQLYGVEARDPITFGSLVVVLALISFLASYLPALRATRIDPVQALRSE